MLAVIQKMLDGDPYPISGQKKSAVGEAEEAQPLPDRIRGILQNRPIVREMIVDRQPEPIVDQSLVSPRIEDTGIDLSLLVDRQPFQRSRPCPIVAGRSGLGSIAFVIAASMAGALIPTMLAAPPLYVSHTTLQMEGQGPPDKRFWMLLPNASSRRPC